MASFFLQVSELSLPVRNNQNLVLKHFNHIRDDDKYCCKELLREEKTEERLNLLKTVNIIIKGTMALADLYVA